MLLQQSVGVEGVEEIGRVSEIVENGFINGLGRGVRIIVALRLEGCYTCTVLIPFVTPKI